MLTLKIDLSKGANVDIAEMAKFFSLDMRSAGQGKSPNIELNPASCPSIALIPRGQLFSNPPAAKPLMVSEDFRTWVSPNGRVFGLCVHDFDFIFILGLEAVENGNHY